MDEGWMYSHAGGARGCLHKARTQRWGITIKHRHTHTPTHTNKNTHAHILTRTHPHTHTRLVTRTRTRTLTLTHTHTHTHIHTHMQTQSENLGDRRIMKKKKLYSFRNITILLHSLKLIQANSFNIIHQPISLLLTHL